MRMRFFTLLLLALLPLALAQTLVGRASVVDGDTLEIRGERVRLWGVDAPESAQTCLDKAGKPWPCGRRAAFALADFLGQRTVSCGVRERDRYGRAVAVCFVGGVEINRWLVAEGWALAYVQYGVMDYCNHPFVNRPLVKSAVPNGKKRICLLPECIHITGPPFTHPHGGILGEKFRPPFFQMR